MGPDYPNSREYMEQSREASEATARAQKEKEGPSISVPFEPTNVPIVWKRLEQGVKWFSYLVAIFLVGSVLLYHGSLGIFTSFLLVIAAIMMFIGRRTRTIALLVLLIGVWLWFMIHLIQRFS